MILVLDTNHLRELAYQSRIGERLRVRIKESGLQVFTTVVSVEEELRGWLARINAERDIALQAAIYVKLLERVNFFARWVVLPLDAESAASFASFRKQGIRIGTQDLKIACITLAHDGVLLTRNAVDFAKVPGLRVENWLD